MRNPQMRSIVIHSEHRSRIYAPEHEVLGNPQGRQARNPQHRLPATAPITPEALKGRQITDGGERVKRALPPVNVGTRSVYRASSARPALAASDR